MKELMKDLIKVFPGDRDIKLLSSSINMAMMDDPKDKVIKRFYNIVGQHGTLIKNKDDAFFRSDFGNEGGDSQLFMKMSSYWDTLHDDNKKAIWNYLHVLLVLSEAVLGTK